MAAGGALIRRCDDIRISRFDGRFAIFTISKWTLHFSDVPWPRDAEEIKPKCRRSSLVLRPRCAVLAIVVIVVCCVCVFCGKLRGF